MCSWRRVPISLWSEFLFFFPPNQIVVAIFAVFSELLDGSSWTSVISVGWVLTTVFHGGLLAISDSCLTDYCYYCFCHPYSWEILLVLGHSPNYLLSRGGGSSSVGRWSNGVWLPFVVPLLLEYGLKVVAIDGSFWSVTSDCARQRDFCSGIVLFAAVAALLFALGFGPFFGLWPIFFLLAMSV